MLTILFIDISFRAGRDGSLMEGDSSPDVTKHVPSNSWIQQFPNHHSLFKDSSAQGRNQHSFSSPKESNESILRAVIKGELVYLNLNSFHHYNSRQKSNCCLDRYLPYTEIWWTRTWFGKGCKEKSHHRGGVIHHKVRQRPRSRRGIIIPG